MNTRFPQRPLRLRGRVVLVAAALAVLTTAGAAAAAQYQWRDDRGRMVYSDLPPPASVPPARIKATGVAQAASPAASPAPEAAAGPAAPAEPASKAKAADSPTPAQTLADRELAYRKRVADREADEKKAAEASERAVKLAKACADAQGDIRSLESGQRISRINAAGEREFLSDAERAERLKNARKSVGERC